MKPSPGWQKAHVVKAFNITGFGNMRNPKFGAVNLTMFYAGDDEAAKAIANQLIGDIGFDPIDAGPSRSPGIWSHWPMLWTNLSMTMGRDIAFQLIKR